MAHHTPVGEGDSCVGGSGDEVMLGRQTLLLDTCLVNYIDTWGMGIDTDVGLGSGNEGYASAASYPAGDVVDMDAGDGVWRDLYPGTLE